MSEALDSLRAALAGRYAIEREIGVGGMATVYLAEDLKHHRQVAVKVLKPELAAALGPDRFLQEIEIAAQLQHPHILPLYDSGGAQGFLFYVMPYVKGQSLRDRIESDGALPISDVVRILSDVVDALMRAHAEGVVHRDIKPDNVLLSDRHALVTDFGVAKAVSEATGRRQLTTAGVTLGTPDYMAPEQASADPNIDHRVDIYAVGALAYEMLTGRPPFVGETPQMVLAAHVTKAADPVTKHRATVPAALESLVMKCLEKQPGERWQSAGELLPHLDAITVSSGGAAPDESAKHDVPSMPREVHSWKKVIVIVVSALGILAAGTAIGRLAFQGGESALDRHKVAFIPLDNRTGDPKLDWVGRQVAEGLANSVTREQIAQVVPVASVVALQSEGIASEGDREMAVARATGAGLVVSGAIYPEGERLRLQLTATDADRQVPFVAIDPITASQDSLAQATDAVSEQVGILLMMMFDEEVGAGATQGYPTLEAYRAFQDGKDRFWELNLDLASGSLLRAAELDSVIRPMALMWAVHSASVASDSALVDSLSAILLGMRDRLPQYLRSVVDVISALYGGNLERMYQSSSEMQRLLPDNPAGKIWHSLICIANNRPREALAVLDGIESVVGDSRARMWWVMRRRRVAFYMLGEYDDALRSAREQREFGGPAFRWSNWHDELVILAAADRRMELEDEIDRFMAQSPAEVGVGRMLANVGLALRLHGEDELGADLIERASEWWDRQPAEMLVASDQRLMHGETLYAAQQWNEAALQLRHLESAQALNVNVVGYLGLIAARQKNRVQADSLAQVLESFTRAGDRGLSILYRARIASVLGDEALAVRLLRQAIDSGYSFFERPFEQFTHWDFASLHDFGPYRQLTEPRG